MSALDSKEDIYSREINKLIIKMFHSEMEEFDLILDYCVLYFGIDNTLKDLIMPFLKRVQIFSFASCEIEIDFAITSIRKKMILAIEQCKPNFYVNKTVLLFLPEGEYFDLIILYYHYVMQLMGYKALYTGANISIGKLESAFVCKKPDLILTYISPKNKRSLQKIKKYLTESPTQYVLPYFENNSIRIPDPKIRVLNFAIEHLAISG